jgi:hypothetical protein
MSGLDSDFYRRLHVIAKEVRLKQSFDLEQLIMRLLRASQ